MKTLIQKLQKSFAIFFVGSSTVLKYTDYKKEQALWIQRQNEKMTNIELIKNNQRVTYSKEFGNVVTQSNKGVLITCRIPNKWNLTEIFNFMQKLLTSSQEL